MNNTDRYRTDPEYRAKVLARRKEYRERNPDKIKTLMSSWKEKNRDRINAVARKWRAKNRERLLIKGREYRSENKEKISAYRKEYHPKWWAENKEWRKENIYKWREENKDKIDAARLRRRERKADRPRPNLCEITGLPGKITYDHNHDNNKFRGWILDQCNRIAGQANDDFDLLRLVADYLEKHWIEDGRPPRNSILVQRRSDPT